MLALQLGVGRLRARQLVLCPCELPPPLGGLALHGLDGLLPLGLLALPLLLLVVVPLDVDALDAVHGVELGQQRLDRLLVDVHLACELLLRLLVQRQLPLEALVVRHQLVILSDELLRLLGLSTYPGHA